MAGNQVNFKKANKGVKIYSCIYSLIAKELLPYLTIYVSIS